MTLNERILDFMDGTLPHEEEAELLHILSVSPERRNLLRSFMNQKAAFVKDRQSIRVPYQAEQALWARLGPLMPAIPVMEQAAEQTLAVPSLGETVVRQTVQRPVPVPVGFFSKVFTGATAAVGAVTLMLGLGLGYFAGANEPAAVNKVYISTGTTPATGQLAQASAPASTTVLNNGRASSTARIYHVYASAPSIAQALTPEIAAPISSANAPQAPAAIVASANEPAPEATVPVVANYASVPSVALRSIGGEDGIRPRMLSRQEIQTPARSFLQRFEFSLTESFGRQFPNSAATNTTLPLITNSSISTMFQVLPRSNALWIGGSFGTANITRKTLYTRPDPLDPLQSILASDTTHSQISYLAGFLQYRLPAFTNADVTFTGGYGFANMGRMLMGEIGMHYDVSREVGLLLGIRGVRFSYDLTQQQEDVIRSGNSSLVVMNAVGNSAPSFNIELNTGLFFHF